MSAKQVVAHLEQEIRSLKSSIAALQDDLRLLHDTVHLKAWLRDYKTRKEPEFDDLMDMLFDVTLWSEVASEYCRPETRNRNTEVTKCR